MAVVSPHGGAEVKRRFNDYRPGMRLTSDQLDAIPRNNLRALAAAGFLTIWPKLDHVPQPTQEGPIDRYLVWTGKAFDVIEGRKVNDEPLSKEDAYALAGKEMPPPKV